MRVRSRHGGESKSSRRELLWSLVVKKRKLEGSRNTWVIDFVYIYIYLYSTYSQVSQYSSGVFTVRLETESPQCDLGWFALRGQSRRSRRPVGGTRKHLPRYDTRHIQLHMCSTIWHDISWIKIASKKDSMWRIMGAITDELCLCHSAFMHYGHMAPRFPLAFLLCQKSLLRDFGNFVFVSNRRRDISWSITCE